MALWPRRHQEVNRTNGHVVIVGVEGHMWNLVDRMVKAVSDVTVGTIIVLVHVSLADRNKRQMALAPRPQRLWS